MDCNFSDIGLSGQRDALVADAGNVATEDLVYLFEGLGIRHGISMDKLLDASDFICSFLKRRNQSRVATALLAARKKASAPAVAA